MKIHTVTAELLHADRRTAMTKLIVAFRNLSSAPNKWNKNVARMEHHHLPLLAFQYQQSEPPDLGRTKERRKYRKYLQGLEKQVLLGLNSKCVLLLLLLLLLLFYKNTRWSGSFRIETAGDL